MNYSKELIKKVYRELPQAISDIVATQTTSSTNDEIAKNYSLSKEQRLEMGDEVTMRLLGITLDSDFVKNIETRLKITPEMSQKISNDIKNKIISKVSSKILSEQEVSAKKILLTTPKAGIQEVPPKNLPMVEPGEVAHSVPHVEQPKPLPPKPDSPLPQAPRPAQPPAQEPKPTLPPTPPPIPPMPQTPPDPNRPKVMVDVPNYKYPGGKDPYREPLA